MNWAVDGYLDLMLLSVLVVETAPEKSCDEPVVVVVVSVGLNHT